MTRTEPRAPPLVTPAPIPAPNRKEPRRMFGRKRTTTITSDSTTTPKGTTMTDTTPTTDPDTGRPVPAHLAPYWPTVETPAERKHLYGREAGHPRQHERSQEWRDAVADGLASGRLWRNSAGQLLRWGALGDGRTQVAVEVHPPFDLVDELQVTDDDLRRWRHEYRQQAATLACRAAEQAAAADAAYVKAKTCAACGEVHSDLPHALPVVAGQPLCPECRDTLQAIRAERAAADRLSNGRTRRVAVAALLDAHPDLAPAERAQ